MVVDSTSGEGARMFGGRFNRQGVPALYCSLSPLTAIREVQPLGRPMQPLTLCAYVVDMEPVFDATDEEHLASMHIDRADLICPDWRAEMLAGRVPVSQAVADRLIAAGFAAMRVRSFAVGADDHDVNVVMWRWADTLPTRVELVDDEGRLRGLVP